MNSLRKEDNNMAIDTIICGDNLAVLKTLPEKFVDCCVTSPPYY